MKGIDHLITKKKIKQVIQSFEFMVRYKSRLVPYTIRKRSLLTRPDCFGDKIVILGNGPSRTLYDENREKFYGFDILCVNFFPEKNEKLFCMYKPRYICLVDPAFFPNNEGMLSDKTNKVWKILKEADWPIKVVTFVRYKGFVTEKGLKCISLSDYGSNKFDVDIIKLHYFKNHFTTQGNTVVNFAIDFSLIFGYKEIALFGIESDWLQNLTVDKDNTVWINETHDYGTKKVISQFNMLQWLISTKNMFSAYYMEKDLAGIANCKVKNYCLNSYVDCFDKVEIDKET